MTFLVETLKGRARLRLKQSLVTHETGNGLKSGRRTGVAPLGRRCRANAGMRERPGQTENASAAAIARFVEEHEITVLNLAGPRLSKWAEGHAFIRHFMPHPSRMPMRYGEKVLAQRGGMARAAEAQGREAE